MILKLTRTATITLFITSPVLATATTSVYPKLIFNGLEHNTQQAAFSSFLLPALASPLDGQAGGYANITNLAGVGGLGGTGAGKGGDGVTGGPGEAGQGAAGGSGGQTNVGGVGGTGAGSGGGGETGGGGGGGISSGGGGAGGFSISGGGGGGGGTGAAFMSQIIDSSTIGGNGGNGGAGNLGGGGGGGGGIAAEVSASATIVQGVVMQGGNGGYGGAGGMFLGLQGSGGGGGAGAHAISFLINGTLTNNGSLLGGTGGDGGLCSTCIYAGNAGSGGLGVLMGAGGSLINNGIINGGAGGIGGISTAAPGSNGLGGVGVSGADLTLINNGTISGGLAGDGITRADAIHFTGGTNTLVLLAGSVLTGNAVAFSTNDTLALGGDTNSIFNVSTIGSTAQYQGFGNYLKTGSSLWTLTGLATEATSWRVDAGTLRVNGILLGTMQVNQGGRLEGLGTVGDTVVLGTVAPGNSIGTLVINGNYTQASGSIYEVEISPQNSSSDLIDITGRATIDPGSQVEVLRSNGVFNGNKYTILTASGGVTGTYEAIQNSAFLNFALSYDPNNVYLMVTQNSFINAAVTPNQRAVAAAAQNLGASDPLFVALLASPTNQDAQQAFNSLSGEVYATILGSLAELGLQVEDLILNRLLVPMSGYAIDPQEKEPTLIRSRFNLWTQGTGSWGARNGNFNTAEVTANNGGIFAGIDAYSATQRLGLVLGYSSLENRLKSRSSKAHADSFHLGLYGEQRISPLVFRIGGAYSWHDLDAYRTVVFPGVAEYLKADYSTNTAQGFFEGAYSLAYGDLLIEPFARASIITVTSNSLREKAGIAALHGGNNHLNTTYTSLGSRASKELYHSDKLIVQGRGLLGWRYAFNSINPIARFAFNGSVPFEIEGSSVARNSLLINAGLDALLPNKALSLSLIYDGQLANRVQAHGILGVLSWHFA